MQISVTPLATIDYSIVPPYQYTLTVAGTPVGLGYDTSNFYATATYENVTISGSPVVAYFDPPVATLAEVDAPSLLLFLLNQLANGAIIGS